MKILPLVILVLIAGIAVFLTMTPEGKKILSPAEAPKGETPGPVITNENEKPVAVPAPANKAEIPTIAVKSGTTITSDTPVKVVLQEVVPADVYCEGAQRDLCPVGQVVSGGKIEYGRTYRSVCPHPTVNENTPLKSQTYDIPLGTNSIKNINELVGTDPYPGVAKHYQISGLTCAPAVKTFRNLCNKHGKCLTAADNSSGNGAPLLQWENKNENGQLWYMEPDGHILNKNGKYLASSGNSSANGAAMIQWDRGDEQGQKWSFNGGNLCNGHGKCLSSRANTAENSSLFQWDKTTENGQQWSFSNTPVVFPDLANGVYSIKGNNTSKFCSDDGFLSCTKDQAFAWEKFNINNVSGNIYNIKGGKNDKYCGVDAFKGLECNRNEPTNFEIKKSGDKFSLKVNGKYCADGSNAGDKLIRCDRDNIGAWEQYSLVKF